MPLTAMIASQADSDNNPSGAEVKFFCFALSVRTAVFAITKAVIRMFNEKRKYHKRKRGYRRFYRRQKIGSRANPNKDIVLAKEEPHGGNSLGTSIDKIHLVDKNDGFLGFNVTPFQPIRVVSMFDGIGTALHILDSLNLQIGVYYSCEIEETALKLLKYRYHDRMIMLGCVRELTEEKLISLGRVDLLIGGSPCSDFSFANPKRQGLQGEQGKLFYEFERVLNFCLNAAESNGHQFFWLFENTFPMEKHIKKQITECLGCEPIMRCASTYLPMRRRRYFWGNIIEMAVEPESTTSASTLQEYLMPYRSANVDLVPTLTSTAHSQRFGKSKSLPVLEDNKESHLLITEEEKLFGFPEHYTDASNLSISDRTKLLGKSWCVPVVSELLRPLTRFFLTRLK